MEIINKSITESAQINLIDGENFSGRSSYLQTLIKSGNTESSNFPFGIMVGEIPSNYISGLAPTVADEIALHTLGRNENYELSLQQLLSDFSFEKHLDKNPFNLSGGEQAILIIICALLLEPIQLAIDTTLEQLNKEWRTPLLLELTSSTFSSTNISIADNRFNEYSLNAKKQKPHSQNNSIDASIKNFGKIICPSDIGLTSTAKNLALNDLSFGYSKKLMLLQDLNFEFESGKVYHLNGINGVGKSTLSKILTGVLKPTKGNLSIANSNYNAYHFPGKVVGYSFQNPDEQIFSNTIRKEVIPKEFIKANKKVEIAETIFSSFALNKFADKHPSEMPFVIRKRIALAATLSNERDWYVLDEPTIGQDQENVQELTKLIKLLALKGKGIILISHSEKFVSSFENVITITLKNGKLIY